ncbi:MAG: ParA family protein [Gemmatimonadales bacterium]|nr:ParA family protein [Gemmatimonadales bacterium]
MRIIAVAMTKGGVGKTTTAVNLSHGLALRGQRVLLVDTDTQGQCAKALGVQADLTLTEVLLGEASILHAVTRARENLDLVASNHHLSRAALAIARRETDGHLALAEALDPVSDRYDVVVLDAAPGVDAIAVNVLGCADEIVAPVALSPAALAGVLDFVRHVERVSRHNAKLHLKYFLPTFLDLRIKQSGEMLIQLREHFCDRVCSAIRVNVELSESFGWRQSIFEYAPKSRGATDYSAFIDLVSENDSAVTSGQTEADLVEV